MNLDLRSSTGAETVAFGGSVGFAGVRLFERTVCRGRLGVGESCSMSLEARFDIISTSSTQYHYDSEVIERMSVVVVIGGEGGSTWVAEDPVNEILHPCHIRYAGIHAQEQCIRRK